MAQNSVMLLSGDRVSNLGAQDSSSVIAQGNLLFDKNSLGKTHINY